jgi:iron(III) transport system substrate-binding protein
VKASWFNVTRATFLTLTDLGMPNLTSTEARRGEVGMKATRLAAAAAATAGALLVAACSSSAGSSSSASSPTAAAAGSESSLKGQTITLYNGQHEQTTDALVKAFEKQTGVTVKVRSDDEDVLAQQMEQEGARSPADVFFTENTPAAGAPGREGPARPVARVGPG